MSKPEHKKGGAHVPPVAPPAPAPKAPEPKVAPPKVDAGPAIPAGFVLARWTGAGMFAGRCYRFPDGQEMPHAKGPTMAWFDEASVRKIGAPLFEPHEKPADGGAPVPAKTVTPDGPPPADHVLARWKLPGRFGGAFFTFPGRVSTPFAQGPTVGYFPAASVEKLKDSFEIL